MLVRSSTGWMACFVWLASADWTCMFTHISLAGRVKLLHWHSSLAQAHLSFTSLLFVDPLSFFLVVGDYIKRLGFRDVAESSTFGRCVSSTVDACSYASSCVGARVLRTSRSSATLSAARHPFCAFTMVLYNCARDH